MEVDYVYAAEGKPYISYVTVKGDKVKHLREAIWINEGNELAKYGLGAASRLSLWKEGEPYQLELDRVLTGEVAAVFKDGETKKVFVTPVAAGSAGGSFTIAGGGGETAQSAHLARELLVPFDPIPITVEEIRSALVARPLRRIPVQKDVYDLLQQDGTAMTSELFECDTSASWAGFVRSPVMSAVYFCLQYGGIEARDSSASRQTIWDLVFYVIWRALLNEAGVGDVTITRDLGSTSGAFASSTRSDLSLKSYGKEVCYVEEHSGLVSASEKQLSKKFKGYLDPRLFGDMRYMIGVAHDRSRDRRASISCRSSTR